MFNKTLFVSALVLVALALGACSPTIMAEAAPPVRTLNVNGTGQVFLSPDIAYIYIEKDMIGEKIGYVNNLMKIFAEHNIYTYHLPLSNQTSFAQRVISPKSEHQKKEKN